MCLEDETQFASYSVKLRLGGMRDVLIQDDQLAGLYRAQAATQGEERGFAGFGCLRSLPVP